MSSIFFFFTATATTEIYTLSLHDALPIYEQKRVLARTFGCARFVYNWALRQKTDARPNRSEEHTSELQSHHDLVCRLLLEKKKKKKKKNKYKTKTTKQNNNQDNITISHNK